MFYTRRTGNICLQCFVLFVVTFCLSWYLVSKPNHPSIRVCFALCLWFQCGMKATWPLPMAVLARPGGGLGYRLQGYRARMVIEDLSRELCDNCSHHKGRNSAANNLCRSNVHNSVNWNSLDLGLIANGLYATASVSQVHLEKSPVISKFLKSIIFCANDWKIIRKSLPYCLKLES